MCGGKVKGEMSLGSTDAATNVSANKLMGLFYSFRKYDVVENTKQKLSKCGKWSFVISGYF
jgi:hypothetical protein